MSGLDEFRRTLGDIMRRPNADVDAYRLGMGVKHEGLVLEPLKLATLTFSVGTTAPQIRYEKILENVARGKSLTKLIVKKKFGNCATFGHKARDGKKIKSIKIYQNGNLHLTGVKCEDDATDIVSQALRAINEVQGGGQTRFSAATVVPTINLHMANFYGKINREIDLETMKTALMKRHRHMAVLLDTNHHPGMQIKNLFGNTSVIVFRTGSILFSGKKDVSNVGNAYKMIMDAVVTMHGGGEEEEEEEEEEEKKDQAAATTGWVQYREDEATKLYDSD